MLSMFEKHYVPYIDLLMVCQIFLLILNTLLTNNKPMFSPSL